MFDVVVKTFTFAISSTDEFLFLFVYEIFREPLNGFASIHTEDVFDLSLRRV